MIRTAVALAVAGFCAAFAADAIAQGDATSDRSALEAIYRATGGDNWTDNANWLSEAPLRDWHGVETNEQGRVIGLRLGGWDETAREHVGNGLVGSLPPELGDAVPSAVAGGWREQRLDRAHPGGVGQSHEA